MELRRVLVNPGSSLNIMSLSNLKALGFSREHAVEQPIGISGFGGDAPLTLGYINRGLAVGTSEQSFTSILLILILLIICPVGRP